MQYSELVILIISVCCDVLGSAIKRETDSEFYCDFWSLRRAI